MIFVVLSLEDLFALVRDVVYNKYLFTMYLKKERRAIGTFILNLSLVGENDLLWFRKYYHLISELRS